MPSGNNGLSGCVIRTLRRPARIGASCRVRRRCAAACPARCPGNRFFHPGPRSLRCPIPRPTWRSAPTPFAASAATTKRGRRSSARNSSSCGGARRAARGGSPPRASRPATCPSRRRPRRSVPASSGAVTDSRPVASPAAERRLDVPVLAGALAAALAPDRVVPGEAVRRRHGTDESFHAPAAPDLVAYPLDVDECARLVPGCAAHRAPIMPVRAGASLEGHIAALRGGVSVDMSRMDRVLRLSVDDMDVTVQAGVTRRQLDAHLRPEGVFFSVDPGADATIGGMVATGASGTTTVRYGAMRENVISLLVVTADGSVVRTRSRARKSSAGYDLTRLFIGSEGTLGLICEATLRIQPTPEAMTAAACAFPTLEDAVETVIEVLAHAIPVARIELLDDIQIDAVNRHFGLGLEVGPTVLLEFHGTPDDTAAQARDVGEITAAHGAHGFDWAAGEAERRALWHARHGAYESARALKPGSVGFTTDACVPISNLARCLRETKADLDASGLLAPIVGHVGDGNFHLAILVDPDDPDELERAKQFNDRLVRRAIALDGTCTGEHGVGYGKSEFLALEHGAVAVNLMRAIKSAWDPENLFNPGKVTPTPVRSDTKASRQ